MNTEVYSRTEKTTDLWQTPKHFFELLDKKFHFTLDPCTDIDNWLGTDKFYTKKDNGLEQDWKGERVFVNPPFSQVEDRKNRKGWVWKCYTEGIKESTLVVLILPARTDTKYWHKYIMKANEIRFCKGRVNFLILCNGCGDLVSKTITYKGNRFCQTCYTASARDDKKVGSGSTFPLVIVIFEKINSQYPVIGPFFHKEIDLIRNRPKLDKLIKAEI